MRMMLAIPLILMGCSTFDNVRHVMGAKERKASFSAEGSVCGVPAIKGDVVGDVPGPGGCGVADAIRITSVGGIALS